MGWLTVGVADGLDGGFFGQRWQVGLATQAMTTIGL